MPIYEYACDKCGHEFEREQKMADPPVKTCPECKGRKVTKLISRSSFVLKGGGWYADGYADSKKSAKDEGSKETKAPSSDSSKKSSDSKESKPSKKKGKGSSKSAA
jgi:putative FmdB family regulatory protein